MGFSFRTGSRLSLLIALNDCARFDGVDDAKSSVFQAFPLRDIAGLRSLFRKIAQSLMRVQRNLMYSAEHKGSLPKRVRLAERTSVTSYNIVVWRLRGGEQTVSTEGNLPVHEDNCVLGKGIITEEPMTLEGAAIMSDDLAADYLQAAKQGQPIGHLEPHLW